MLFIMIILVILYLYIVIGLIITLAIIFTARHISSDCYAYNSAQEIMSNLKNFICFSKAVFKWPCLVRIIYSGGTNDI